MVAMYTKWLAKPCILKVPSCSFFLYKITQIFRLVAIILMYLYSYKVIILLTKSSDMLNKNTWDVKQVRGQEEPATKSSDIK